MPPRRICRQIIIRPRDLRATSATITGVPSAAETMRTAPRRLLAAGEASASCVEVESGPREGAQDEAARE